MRATCAAHLVLLDYPNNICRQRIHTVVFLSEDIWKKVKCKADPQQTYGGAKGKRRYNSYSFMTSALDVCEESASRPVRTLAPGKGLPVPIVQEAGWASETVWTQRLQEKSFPSGGDRTWIARSSSP
jgi:hypothetical protein